MGLEFRRVLFRSANLNFNRFNIELIFRNYSKSYISTHSGAISSSSGNYNQTGVSLAIKRNINNYTFLLLSEYSYFPWVRFGVDKASIIFKNSLKFEYNVNNFNISSKLSYNYSSYKNSNKFILKPRVNMRFKENRFGFRGEVTKLINSSWGVAFNYDSDINLYKKCLLCYFGGGLYNVDNWEQRLYLYERDLPYSYSSRLMYGRGYFGYLIIKWDIKRLCDVYVKQDIYINKKGEANTSPSKSYFKFGVKLSL